MSRWHVTTSSYQQSFVDMSLKTVEPANIETKASSGKHVRVVNLVHGRMRTSNCQNQSKFVKPRRWYVRMMQCCSVASLPLCLFVPLLVSLSLVLTVSLSRCLALSLCLGLAISLSLVLQISLPPCLCVSPCIAVAVVVNLMNFP